MAIALQDKTNVDLPSVEYPYGKIRDNTGSNNGTPVNTLVYGDIHQFFARLLVDAGVAANGLAENATNGFQYNQALLVLTGSVGTINSVTKSANGMVKSGSSYIMQTADATYPGLVSPTDQIFAGSKTITGQGRFQGWYTSGTGLALEIGVDAGSGQITAYNRTALAFAPVKIYSNAREFVINPTSGFSFTGANVGIGTTSANAQLQLGNSVANRKLVIYESANNDHQFFGWGIGSSLLRYQVSSTLDDHVFYAGTSPTTSTELMRIKGNGLIGIGGSPSSGYQLDVMATAGAMRVTSTGTNQAIVEMRRTGGTASSWQIYLPTGSTDLRFYSGADRFTFSAAGHFTCADMTATSDRRLKNNIMRVDAHDTLSRVALISRIVSSYDRIDTGKHEIGFIAQELFEVAPEYVVVPDDRKAMMSVNYSKMVVPLYSSVAELLNRISQLETKLKAHGIT